MATHSNILAWEIPWTEEPGGLWSTGLQRVRHNRSNFAGTHAHKDTHILVEGAVQMLLYRANRLCKYD